MYLEFTYSSLVVFLSVLVYHARFLFKSDHEFFMFNEITSKFTSTHYDIPSRKLRNLTANNGIVASTYNLSS